MDLLDRIEQHFRPDEVRRLEVPEWGTPAELGEDGKVKVPANPLVITYKPVTLDDQSFLQQVSDGDRHRMGAHMVCLKACDVDGKRLFQQIDAVRLREKADPVVIARITAQMLSGLTIAEARKN